MAIEDLIKEIDAHIATAKKPRVAPRNVSTSNPDLNYIPLVETPEQPGFISGNLKKSFATLGTATGGALRYAGADQLGKETEDYWKAKQAEYEKARPSMTTADVTGVGSGAKFVAENVLKNAAIGLPALALGGGAAALAARAGMAGTGIGTAGAIGGFGGNLGLETGLITSDTDPSKPLDRLQIFKGALPAALLETAPEILGFAKTGLGKTSIDYLNKKFGPEAATAVKSAAVKSGLWKDTAKDIGKTLAIGTVGEGITESAQTPLEAWGSGKQVFKDGQSYSDNIIKNTAGALTGGIIGGENYTPEMRNEMFESGAAGAAGGLGMTGGGIVVNKALGINDNKTETSLTPAPTKEEAIPQYSEENALTRKWTAADVEAQNTPELQAAVREQILRQEEEELAQAEYDQTPEGQADLLEKERLAWREDLVNRIQRNPRLTAEKEYKNLGKTGTTEEEVAANQRKRAWMENDPVFAATIPEIQKKKEAVIKEEQKRQEELGKKQREFDAFVTDFNLTLDDYNAKIKEAETEEQRKALRRQRDADEAKYEGEVQAKTAEMQSLEAPIHQAEMRPDVFTGEPTDTETGYRINPETQQMVDTGEAAQNPVSSMTEVSGVTLPGQEKVLGQRAVAKYNADNKTHFTLVDMVFNRDADTKQLVYDENHLPTVSPKATIDKAVTGTDGITEKAITVKKPVATPKAVVKKVEEKPASKPILRKKVTPIVEKVEEPTPTPEKVEKPFDAAEIAKGFKFKKTEGGQLSSREDFKPEHVVSLIEHMLGKNAKVELIDDNHIKAVDPSGKMIEIPAAFIVDTIAIATGAKTLYENVRHEVVHAAKQMGLFTPQEWKILSIKANKWIKEFKIDERYKGLTKEEMQEEAIARAFENNPEESSVFTKLKNFIEKVVNFLRGLGYESTQTVFTKLNDGAFASRTVNAATNGMNLLASLADEDLSEATLVKHFGALQDAFGGSRESLPGTTSMMKDLFESIRKLKDVPKTMAIQKILVKANAINQAGLELHPEEMFYKQDRTISFEKLKSIPKEKRVEAFLEAIKGKAPRSEIVRLYTQYQKNKDHKNPSDKMYLKGMSYLGIKAALEKGVYYDGTHDSFHAKISVIHNRATNSPSWDADNAIFAFIHTGFSDESLVPELFLPIAEVHSDVKYKKAQAGLIPSSHQIFTDAMWRSMANGYRERLGLDMNTHGLRKTPIPDLVLNSKLINDIIEIARDSRKGTLIKLKDYKNEVDRNPVAMAVINYLEDLRVIRIFDMETKDTKFDTKVGVDRIERDKKNRKTIMEFFAGEGEGEIDLDVQAGTNTAVSKTEALNRDVSRGDTYIAFNPEFFADYAMMGSMEDSADVAISKVFKQLGVGYDDSALYLLNEIASEKDRKFVYNSIEKNRGDNKKLLNDLITYATNKFKKKYGLTDSDTLDSGLVAQMHEKAGIKQSVKEKRADFQDKKNAIGEIRTINGYKMPIQYSAALYLAAENGVKTFKNASGQNKKINTETGRKEYHASGEARLYKAIQAILVHRAHFDLPIHGDFENFLMGAVDFFKGNGNILDTVTKETVFPSGKQTITDAKFNELIPVITPVIQKALGLINEFGVPETASDKPSLVQRLEQSVDTQSDKLSSYKSVDHLMDDLDDNVLDRNEELISEIATEEAVEEDTDAVEEPAIEDIDTDEDVEDEIANVKLGSKEIRALNALIQMLKPRVSAQTGRATSSSNNAVTEIITSEKIQVEAQKRASSDPALKKLIDAAKTNAEVSAIIADIAQTVVDEKYTELIKAATELRDSEKLTIVEREKLKTTIKSLAKELKIDFKSKDMRIDRDVRLNLGTIFHEYGNDWSDSQKETIVERLKPLVASIIYGASRKLNGSNVIADKRLGLQISTQDTESATATRFHYLNIHVAEDMVKVDAADYKPINDDIYFPKKTVFDESLYDDNGKRKALAKIDATNIIVSDLGTMLGKSPEAIRMAKKFRDQAREEARDLINKILNNPEEIDKRVSENELRELYRDLYATHPELQEESRLDFSKEALQRFRSFGVVPAKTVLSPLDKLLKQKASLEQLAKTLAKEAAKGETTLADKANTYLNVHQVVTDTLWEMVSSLRTEKLYSGATHEVNNMKMWDAFLKEAKAKINSQLEPLTNAVHSTTITTEKGKVVNKVIATKPAEFSQKELTKTLAAAIIEMKDLLKKNPAVTAKALGEISLDVQNIIPTGTIFKETKAKGISIRVIPTTLNPSKWVSFNEIDYSGAVKGGTRHMLRTEFDRNFKQNTKEDAAPKHEAFRYNKQMAATIDFVKAKNGIAVRGIMGDLLDFFGSNKGNRKSLQELTDLITKEQEGSPFKFANYEKSGFTNPGEFKFYLENALIRILREADLIEKDGAGNYTGKVNLTNFYRSISMGSPMKAKLGDSIMEATRKFTSNPQDMFRAIKNIYKGVSETKLFSFFKNMFLTPWVKARGFRELENIMFTAGEMSDKLKAWVATFTGTNLDNKDSARLGDVLAKLGQIKKDSLEQHQAIHQLVLEGDKRSLVFKNIEQAKLVSPNITKHSFDAYLELQDMLGTTLSKITFDAGAHMYLAWANARFNISDHTLVDALVKAVANKDELTRSEVNSITDSLLKLIPDDTKREEARVEMRRTVTGYESWLKEKRTLISKTIGWMPRVRFVQDYVATAHDKEGNLSHIRYFKNSVEANGYIKSIKGSPTVATTAVGRTDSDTKFLFTSQDQIKGMASVKDIEAFLNFGIDESKHSPAFGVGILGDDRAGGVHMEGRVRDLVLGYEDTDYLANYQTALNRMATSFGKLQYGLEQRENLRQAIAAGEKNNALKQLIPEFKEHLRLDLAPAREFEQASLMVRNLTVFTFMGFRLLPAIVNSTQAFTIGIPMLAERLTKVNGKSYTSNLSTALNLTKEGFGIAVADLKKNILGKENTKMSDILAKAVGASIEKTGHKINFEGMNLSDGEEKALREFYKFNVATQSLNHSVNMINDYKEQMAVQRMGKNAVAFNKFVSESMTFMRLTEQLNRTATFMAAYKSLVGDSKEFNMEAAREASAFVYDSQFMVNSFNMPLSIKKTGPIGRAIMTLGMYPIHLLNQMVRMGGGGKDGVKTLFMVLGMAMMLGGSGALPLKDIISALYMRLFGTDLNLDVRNLVKDAGLPDTFGNVINRGLPTAFGVDVSGNLQMSTPFVGAFLDSNKSAIESATGAAGGVFKRWFEARELFSEGKYGQGILEKFMPEVVSAPARNIRQYNDGIRTKSSVPTMYQGKELKMEMNDLILAAIPMLSIKSSRLGTIQENRQSIRALEQDYKVVAAKAQKYAQETGDLSHIQDFNKKVQKNKLNVLIPTLKVSRPRNEPKGRAAYENNPM